MIFAALKMNLESLANEIFLDIFEYLDTIRLFRAFDGLNRRFNALIRTDCRECCLDFRRISKNDFHFFCKEYLPSLVDRVVTWHISDGDETPKLIQSFLSYPYSSHHFVHLQSLSLYDIGSIDIVIQLIKQYHRLRHLHLTKFYIIYQEQIKFPELLNSIWNLPLLVTYCLKSLSTCPELDMEFTVVSTSIKSLILDNVSLRCDLLHLFEYTPNLSRLSLDILRPNMHSLVQTFFPSIVSLDMKLSQSHAPFNFLSSMPNLTHLKFELYGYLVGGHEWERLITSYLLRLTRLELKMNFSEEIPKFERTCAQLLNTFRTPFWLTERQWFVRCVGFFACRDCAIFYTLPYSFDQIPYRHERWSYSTCSNETIRRSSDHYVKSVEARKEPLHSCEDLHRLTEHYPNVRHLACHLGNLTNDFCSSRPLINRLTSMSLVLFDNTWFDQLQTFVDHSPHLYSLTIVFMLILHKEIFQLQSSSIRRLSVYCQSLSYGKFKDFSAYECQLLANSLLGQRCEVLSIVLQSRFVLLDLLKTMTQLRSINVEFHDDTWQSWYPLYAPRKVDEHLKWLQNELPSSYSIRRNSKKASFIQIWIG